MARKSTATKVAQLEALKYDRDQLDAQIKALQADIISDLDALQQKSITVDLEDRSIKATKVEPVRTVIDENSLKRTLGEKLWMKVSSRVLDKKKLEAHIASGEVDPLAVAECSTESPSAPYVKLS